MSEIYINGRLYDSDDKLELMCPCGEYFYDAPEYINYMDVTSEQKKDFDYGIWGIAFCPKCYIFVTFPRFFY